MKKILIIIPAYNEEGNILKTYNMIRAADVEGNYDIIVINDGSDDNTKAICEANNIPIVSLVHNLGIGGAVQTGYKYGFEKGYDFAVQFDGDGQHDATYIKHLIKPLKDNKSDFVIGSRFIKGSKSQFKSSASRRMGIKLISLVIYFVTRKKIYDTTSGFRACNSKITEEFAKAYPYEYPEPITTTELLKKKYRIKEIPAEMNERQEGKSSIHSYKNIYYMLNVILSILIIGVRRVK